MPCSAYSKRGEVLDWIQSSKEDHEQWMSIHPLYRAYLTVAPVFIVSVIIGVFAYLYLI